MFKLSIFLILLPFVSFAQSMHHQMKSSPAKDVFLNMMDKMMMKMDDIAASKSADRDFLQMMIPHHEGAINMADYEIAHGRNREMIQLAKSIKAEQEVQIRQMQLSLSKSESLVVTGTQHIEPNKQMMVVMMDKMPSNKIPANTDKAFAATMIPHHQAAIDMAKVELQYGADKNTKRLAEMIISEEQVEIEQMKKIK
jgi:uncharacterized protein (DUF305 family)